jgi:curli biogenesis system outer membrane secretion channel CsgG
MAVGRKPVYGTICVGILVGSLCLGGCDETSKVTPVTRNQAELRRIHTVAVLPFLDAPGMQAKGSGEGIVNAITTQLYQCRGIQVVERSRVSALMQERDLHVSQMQDTSVAAEFGKLAEADAVFMGSLTQYEAQQDYSHGAVYAFSAGGTKHIHRVGVSVRLVDVHTGQVLYAEDAGGKDKEGYAQAAKIAAGRALKPLRDFYEIERGPK